MNNEIRAEFFIKNPRVLINVHEFKEVIRITEFNSTVIMRYPSIFIDITDAASDNEIGTNFYHTYGWVYSCHYLIKDDEVDKSKLIIDFFVNDRYPNDYYGEAFASSRIIVPVDTLQITDSDRISCGDKLDIFDANKKLQYVNMLTSTLIATYDAAIRSEFFG
jgi:hypothetical protein